MLFQDFVVETAENFDKIALSLTIKKIPAYKKFEMVAIFDEEIFFKRIWSNGML